MISLQAVANNNAAALHRALYSAGMELRRDETSDSLHPSYTEDAV